MKILESYKTFRKSWHNLFLSLKNPFEPLSLSTARDSNSALELTPAADHKLRAACDMQGLWGSSRVFFERAFKDLSNDIWLARLFDKPESLIFSIVNNLLKHTTQGVRRWLLADYYFSTCKQRFLIEFVRLFYRPKYLQWAPGLLWLLC